MMITRIKTHRETDLLEVAQARSATRLLSSCTESGEQHSKKQKNHCDRNRPLDLDCSCHGSRGWFIRGVMSPDRGPKTVLEGRCHASEVSPAGKVEHVKWM